MNLNQAMQVMLRTHMHALQSGRRANAIELVSGPGVGKSSTVRQVCIHLAREVNAPVGLVTNMLATLQSVDIRGFMLPVKAADGTPRPMTVFSVPPWMPTKLTTVVFTPDGVEHAPGSWDGPIPEVGVCFLDEWGQGEDDVKKAAAELLLHGEVGTDRLPMGWRVIAASNRLSDRAGVVRSLTFITNRRIELRIDAHLPTWVEWANGLLVDDRPHHYTISFASKNPDLVFKDSVPPGDAPFCTPRTLVLMDRDLQALRTPEDIARDRLPTDPIAREVCSGWIGGGEGAQFFTHLKYSDVLPDVGDIVRDPMKAKLPEPRDAQMVCAFMLAHHVEEKSAAPIMKYMQRLGIDMQVLTMRTITARTEHARLIANTPDFTNWLLKHKDLLVASHS